MTVENKFEVWGCDLNDLYAENYNPIIPDYIVHECATVEEARNVRDGNQTHDMAAWVVDKETHKIV